jgi:hypothetical protein
MKVRWEGGDAIISQMDISDLVKFSYEQGKRTLEKREPEILKQHGQFLAPPAVARYMAKQFGKIKNGSTNLNLLLVQVF